MTEQLLIFSLVMSVFANVFMALAWARCSESLRFQRERTAEMRARWLEAEGKLNEQNRVFADRTLAGLGE